MHATFDFGTLDALNRDFKLGEKTASGAFGVDPTGVFGQLVEGFPLQAGGYEGPFTVAEKPVWR